VIKNPKRLGPIAVFSIYIANIAGLEAKDIVIWRIDYDFDFVRLTTARSVDLFCMRDSRSARDRKADTPLLQPFQHEHAELSSGSLKIVCMSSGMDHASPK